MSNSTNETRGKFNGFGGERSIVHSGMWMLVIPVKQGSGKVEYLLSRAVGLMMRAYNLFDDFDETSM